MEKKIPFRYQAFENQIPNTKKKQKYVEEKRDLTQKRLTYNY